MIFRTWPYTMTTPYWSDFVPNSTLNWIFNVSIELLRRMWLADRGRLLLRTPGPVPLGLAYVLLVETNLFTTCYFSGLCSLNIPRSFLDFAKSLLYVLTTWWVSLLVDQRVPDDTFGQVLRSTSAGSVFRAST